MFYDLYISPEELKTKAPDDSGQTVVLAKGQTKEIDGHEITFEQFDLGMHTDEGIMAIGAVLKVKVEDGKTVIIKPVHVVTDTDKPNLIPAKMPSGNKFVYLLSMSADEGIIELGISDKDTAIDFEPQSALILHLSIKPLINLVWLGLIMIIIGSGLATYRRIKEVE